MVNDLKMLELIVAKPGIRTVELSDRLDCDIEKIEEALRGHVERKFLDEHKVIAPNGRKAKAYTLAGVPLPDPSAAPAKTLTVVEKAIAFIQAQPEQQVTGAALHIALDLKIDEAPSKVLADGLADGRLVKEGKWWTVGPNLEVAAMAAAIGISAEQMARDWSMTQYPAVVTAGVDVQADRTEIKVADWPKAQPAKTKIGKVIDYLKEHGTTDTDTIRKLLGIEDKWSKGKKPHPGAYLADALADGRIKRDGSSWWVPGYETRNASPVPGIPRSAPENSPAVAEKPGAVPPNEVKVAESASSGEVKPEVQVTILDHFEEVDAMWRRAAASPVAQRYQTAPEDEKASEFIVALLSNSNLELRLDGQTVILKKSEWTHMREFINKVELA